MILRQAELKDKKEIMDVANLLYLPIPYFIWNNESFVEEQIKNKEYFLGEDYGTVIGIMSLRQRANKINIETLAVKKEFQSKGFGTQFIEFAMQFTKEKGFDTLHAYSFNEYNMAGFYLKKGFIMLDHTGSYHNNAYYCFEKKL
ncbi:MAG: hypothetical protein A2908_03850 [Candidatus Staskawiczbacteria bacterium RIFCSPLOWO2_01_FULL_38_12b]|uniref:N-acetyltransferase domain-containing protein n=1 Tax=Candidatus Staskawiczbacteria bacterium RIFCSPLOWO2_01_FULL_38_12b TaxID=1802214 RepID=A0A1G2ICA7_9BACT|nr:MAG: hypothetical protein A2908_03850 [Candidatus Staskawiczbacteria bacterium RIFCSPLOWO2_01_FULL_38_12b]